jgi:hypothetical protein
MPHALGRLGRGVRYLAPSSRWRGLSALGRNGFRASVKVRPLLLRRPLARVETQVALLALAHRLVNPRLVTDPPPYRPNPTLRGPRHLLVEFDTLAPATEQEQAAHG